LARSQSHSEKARQGGLPRDPPPCKPLLEARLCGHRRSPKARVSYPNSLGERWSISLRASALSSSKASRVLLGRADLLSRASRPLSLKSWMASRTVWRPQPRASAIFGAYSPLELARSACHRRKVKVSFERSPAWRASCSSSENERTKIGVFMVLTVTRNTKPILKLHYSPNQVPGSVEFSEVRRIAPVQHLWTFRTQIGCLRALSQLPHNTLRRCSTDRLRRCRTVEHIERWG
jgi:hypothetical protein